MKEKKYFLGSKRMHFWFVGTSIALCGLIFVEPNRTLSSKLGGIQSNSYTATVICQALDIILSDPDHCHNEYLDYLKENH